jgi:hypothetical protein
LSARFGLTCLLICSLCFISCKPGRSRVPEGKAFSRMMAHEEPQPDLREEGVTYKQLDEDVFDRGHMTKVTTSLLLEDGITKPNIEALLRKLYRKTAARSDFQYHPHPTDVAIFAYLTREHAESGMGQWVAMLEKTPQESEPVIRFDDVQLDLLHEPPVMRFGLSDEQRRAIFRDVTQERDIAQGGTRDTTVWRDSISRRYKISRLDLDSLVAEGMQKHWAMAVMPQSW